MSTLSIRLPESTHSHAKRLAKQEGYSLNQFIASAVAEKLAALDTEAYLSKRATRGRQVNIGKLLDKVPARSPEARDGLES